MTYLPLENASKYLVEKSSIDIGLNT